MRDLLQVRPLPDSKRLRGKFTVERCALAARLMSEAPRGDAAEKSQSEDESTSDDDDQAASAKKKVVDDVVTEAVPTTTATSSSSSLKSGRKKQQQTTQPETEPYMPTQSKGKQQQIKPKRVRVKGQRGHVSSEDDGEFVDEAPGRATAHAVDSVADRPATAAVSKGEPRDGKPPGKSASKKKKKKGRRQEEEEEEDDDDDDAVGENE